MHVMRSVQGPVSRESRVMVVYLRWTDVVVVVFWAVYCFRGVYVCVHFCCDSECVQVWYTKDSELAHDGSCVCSWWYAFDESEDFFLGSDEGLEASALWVVGSPDGNVADQVWEG